MIAWRNAGLQRHRAKLKRAEENINNLYVEMVRFFQECE
jgi:hypothetical protein